LHSSGSSFLSLILFSSSLLPEQDAYNVRKTPVEGRRPGRPVTVQQQFLIWDCCNQ
jgi:hypothetical protein